MLTGVGKDRVGIVADVAELLLEIGCNLLDSSMTLLRGEFAIILMVRLSEGGTIEKVRKNVAAAEKRLGLTIHVRELGQDEIKDEESLDAPHIISVYGADKPGIVAGITRALADLKINITDVETKYTGDSNTRKPVFLMIIEVTVPRGMETEHVRSELQAVSKKLGVDIAIECIEVMEL